LIEIKRGVGAEVGRWFDDNLGREAGDGTTTLFWWDPWIDGVILKRNFRRLFDLIDNKMATVVKVPQNWSFESVKIGGRMVLSWARI